MKWQAKWLCYRVFWGCAIFYTVCSLLALNWRNLPKKRKHPDPETMNEQTALLDDWISELWSSSSIEPSCFLRHHSSIACLKNVGISMLPISTYYCYPLSISYFLPIKNSALCWHNRWKGGYNSFLFVVLIDAAAISLYYQPCPVVLALILVEIWTL